MEILLLHEIFAVESWETDEGFDLLRYVCIYVQDVRLVSQILKHSLRTLYPPDTCASKEIFSTLLLLPQASRHMLLFPYPFHSFVPLQT